MKKILILLALTILSLGCLRDLDVKYPEGGQMLSLHAVLQPGDSIRAHLTSTLPFEDTRANPYYRDALITLSENGKLVDTLKVCETRYRPSEADSVYIYCSYHPVKAGSTYELRALRSGFPEVWGTTTVPARGKVERIESWKEPGISGQSFELSIRDAGRENNFYMLNMYHIRLYWNTYTEKTRAELISNEPGIYLYSYFGILKLPIDPDRGHTAYFTDQYFQGTTKTIRLRADTKSNDDVNYVELHTVSAEYYEYLKARNINDALGEHPFSEPVRIPSNVTNGFGLVGSVNTFALEF